MLAYAASPDLRRDVATSADDQPAVSRRIRWRQRRQSGVLPTSGLRQFGQDPASCHSRSRIRITAMGHIAVIRPGALSASYAAVADGGECRYPAVQFHKSWSRSAAVRIGRHSTRSSPLCRWSHCPEAVRHHRRGSQAAHGHTVTRPALAIERVQCDADGQVVREAEDPLARRPRRVSFVDSTDRVPSVRQSTDSRLQSDAELSYELHRSPGASSRFRRASDNAIGQPFAAGGQTTTNWLSFVESPDSEGGQLAQKLIPEALKQRGWDEGGNLVIEWRGERQERRPARACRRTGAQQGRDHRGGTNFPIRAAMKATQTIPIVMLNGNFPVETGLVQSLARPGGNVTGTSYWASTESLQSTFSFSRSWRHAPIASL